MKFTTFLKPPQGLGRNDFYGWFKQTYVRNLVNRGSEIRRAVYRCEVDAPDFDDTQGLPRRPATNGISVVVELWLPTADHFADVMSSSLGPLSELGGEYASYHVRPRLQADPRVAEAGANGSRPEVTMIACVQWRRDISADQASAIWDDHASIALSKQPALTKYEQNIVERVMGTNSLLPPIDAYGDFSLRTISDAVSRFIPTPEERQDGARFIETATFSYFGDAEPVQQT